MTARIKGRETKQERAEREAAEAAETRAAVAKARADAEQLAQRITGGNEAAKAAASLRRSVLSLVRLNFVGLVARMRDAEEGQPGAASYDGPAVSGTPGSRLPVRLGRNGQLVEDVAKHDEHRALELVGIIVAATNELGQLRTAWTPKAARAEQRRQAEADNQKYCEHCCGIVDPITGKPRREELLTKDPTNVGGRLADRLRLCRWCCDFVTKTAEIEGAGRLATDDELDRHYNRKQQIRLRSKP